MKLFYPPLPVLLDVPHLHQKDSGECLATCVTMVLNYYRVSHNYQQLLKTLRIEPQVGAPFSNIKNLESLGLLVGYRQNGQLEVLYRLLANGWPAIISVDTGELPYWPVSTGHTVVLVGMESEFIYLNDPAMIDSPIQVSSDDFYLAWFEQNLTYAVLSS